MKMRKTKYKFNLTEKQVNIPKAKAIKIIKEMDSEKYIGKYSFNVDRFKIDIIKKIIDSEENKNE